MNRARQILFPLLAAFIAIQFVRPARNQSGQVLQSDISNSYSIPHDVGAILKNACFDCHSNNTNYPWYFNIQPVGWLLAKDIENGKDKLNFSEIGSLSSRKQISKLQEVENRIKDGTMPLRAYQIMHPSARLAEGERRLLVDWIEKTKDTIVSQRWSLFR